MASILEKVGTLFEREIGLNPKSLSENDWLAALEERMKASGIVDPEEYLRKLLESRDERRAFIEKIVVPETWFFRHEEAFSFLRHLVHHVWSLETWRKEPLRLLSVPCSTGEEPYSIAMTLLEAGVPGAWFEVDAVDISENSLETAKKGLFSAYAFRNKYSEQKKNFFTKEKKRYKILDLVKKQVRFHRGNIADPRFLIDEKPYDVIFCRNLFIYLQPSVLGQVEQSLKRLLAPGGIFFVSPVEASIAIEWGFAQQGPSGAAAFGAKKAAPRLEKKIEKKRDFLQEARALADAGNLDLAYQVCAEWVAKNSTDAEGQFLLAVIEHARGNEYNAEKGFRKALYLAPTHHETLTYLTLLAEKRGDLDEAKLYKERARQ